MQLSFCAIVKNEAALLPQCLASVRDVVDEMIVVDTGSTDRTIAIAQEFGAQVYTFEWCNDFAAARNASLQYAQGEWILVLDADEQLVPTIVPALHQAIATPDYILINLMRQEVGALQTPYSMVSRLFRNRPEIRFSRPYHELVDDSVMQVLQRQPQWQVGYLPDVAILHQGYQPDMIATRDKATRARSLLEAFLKTHPDDPYTCSKLGALYVQEGHLQQGVELLVRGLQAVQSGTHPPGESEAPLLYELHYHLGSVYSELGNPTQAERHYRAAMQQRIAPRLKLGAINNLGSLLKERGDLLSAKRLYEQTIWIDRGFAIGYYNLGMTLKALGNFSEAIATYHQAIALNPQYAEAYQNLGVVLLKVGNVPDGLAAFRQAIALYQQQGSAEGNHLQQALQDMGFAL